MTSFDTKLGSSEREIISYSLLKDKVCVLGERKKSQATAAFVHKVQRLSVFMALYLIYMVFTNPNNYMPMGRIVLLLDPREMGGEAPAFSH